MKRLDLSVGQRLAAGSAMVAILIVILGSTVLTSITRVSALRHEKTETIQPRARAADDLERSVYEAAVAFRNYALSGAPADLEAFRRSQQSIAHLMERITILQKSAAGESVIAEIEPLVDEHQQSFETFLAMMRSGADREALHAQEAVISAKRNRLLEKVRSFADLQQQQSEAADANINRAVDMLRRSTVAITLLILIASVATAALVAQSVRAPAIRLGAAAEAMGDGSYEPALALQESGAPFRDELRQAAHVFGRMAATLQSRESRLAAHSRLAGVLGTSLDPQEVANHALREITSHLGTEIGALYLAEDDGTLHVAASVALWRQTAPLGLGEGIPGEAAATRRTIAVRDIPPDTPFAVRLGVDDVPPRCIVAVPMLVKDRIVGVIVAGSLHDLDEEAIRFLEQSAAQLAITLDNARAHARIAAQAEELQVQNEELQAQGEELQVQSEELQTQAESLTEINEALVAAEEQKNRFLAVLGHELRNPLAAISTAAGLLDESENGIHDIIRRQSAHLGRLLDDLLDIGRITSGKIVLTRQPLDVAAVAERCVRSIAQKNVRLQSNGPVWADADETRIEQIITNLLTNAIKFTPPDGRITVRVERDGRDVVLSVADTGRGIDATLLPRVFDLFVQGEHGPGLGVGLALVKNLVELHGGSVEARSTGAGAGTTMTVRLPALDEVPAAVAAAGAQRLPIKRSIVIVEDNADVRRMLRLLLESSGHAVTDADSGPNGVAVVTDVCPEVALIDLDLPGFDGCEVARRIRLDRRLDGVRLIALSGFGRPEDRDRALAAGFNEHLAKPVEIERLQEVITQDDEMKNAEIRMQT